MTSAAEELTPIPYRRILLIVVALFLMLVLIAGVQEYDVQSRARAKERLVRSLISVGMSDSEAVAALAKVKIDAFCNGSESDVDSHCSQRLISLRKNDGLMHLPRTIEYVLTDSDKWTNFGAKYWIIIEINDDGVITEIE